MCMWSLSASLQGIEIQERFKDGLCLGWVWRSDPFEYGTVIKQTLSLQMQPNNTTLGFGKVLMMLIRCGVWRFTSGLPTLASSSGRAPTFEKLEVEKMRRIASRNQIKSKF